MGSESSQNMVIYTLFDVLVFISFPTIPCQQREITQNQGELSIQNFISKSKIFLFYLICINCLPFSLMGVNIDFTVTMKTNVILECDYNSIKMVAFRNACLSFRVVFYFDDISLQIWWCKFFLNVSYTIIWLSVFLMTGFCQW